MGATFPFLIAILFSAGFYLLMSRNALRLVLGTLLLGQGTNLFLLLTGGLKRGDAPILSPGADAPIEGPEPLSQALILTAIVISFAVTTFVVVLIRQAYGFYGMDDTDEWKDAEA